MCQWRVSAQRACAAGYYEEENSATACAWGAALQEIDTVRKAAATACGQCNKKETYCGVQTLAPGGAMVSHMRLKGAAKGVHVLSYHSTLSSDSAKSCKYTEIVTQWRVRKSRLACKKGAGLCDHAREGTWRGRATDSHTLVTPLCTPARRLYRRITPPGWCMGDCIIVTCSPSKARRGACCSGCG